MREVQGIAGHFTQVCVQVLDGGVDRLLKLWEQSIRYGCDCDIATSLVSETQRKQSTIQMQSAVDTQRNAEKDSC